MTRTEQRRVAIVDDDAAVRDSLRLLLEIIGYHVETFASGAEFLSVRPETSASHLSQLSAVDKSA